MSLDRAATHIREAVRIVAGKVVEMGETDSLEAYAHDLALAIAQANIAKRITAAGRPALRVVEPATINEFLESDEGLALLATEALLVAMAKLKSPR